MARVFANPYVLSPLVFGGSITAAALVVPSEYHTTADLLLAGLITVVTSNVAYAAANVLGTVLLQTSPPRGTASGRMEAFLRAMREVERHPQIVHLPAPHIWQLSPTGKGGRGGGTVVATIELHVRADLADEEALRLTKWAHDRASGALAGEGEVTVGVVRG